MPITLDGSTGEVFPSWTTAGRPASPVAGQTGYNSTLNALEVYNGSTWTPFVSPTLMTAQNTTSGTSIIFSGIPSWAKRVTIMFNGVSTSGASQVRIRIGPSGGVETTGYLGSAGLINGANLCLVQNFTAGFDYYDTVGATQLRYGSLILSLVDSTANTWAAQSVMGQATGAVGYLGGIKSLAGVLTQVAVTTVNGTDAFDAGSANVMYEG